MGRENASPEILRLAEALTESPEDRQALLAAERVIEGGAGKALFDALYARQRSDEVDRSEAVCRLMGLLEVMTDANACVAGYLMGRLYKAPGRDLHDIHDGIGLFLTESKDPRLADTLTALAHEATVGPSLKKTLLAWVRLLRERSSRSS
jgi:hypothetical protein